MFDSTNDTVPVSYLTNDVHYQAIVPRLRSVVDHDGYVRYVKSHRSRIAPRMRLILWAVAVSAIPFLAIVSDYV